MIRVNVNLGDEHATVRADAVESAFGYMHSPMMLRSAVWAVADPAVDPTPRGPWHPPESDIPFRACGCQVKDQRTAAADERFRLCSNSTTTTCWGSIVLSIKDIW
jgi:hypothetical protein